MTSSIIALILGVIVAIDHVLAAIPSVAASSTFQLIANVVAALAGANNQPPAAK